MSRDISPDVLELLERIRAERKGATVEDAIYAARDKLLSAHTARVERRMWLLQGAAWALYALELHDAAAKPGDD